MYLVFNEHLHVHDTLIEGVVIDAQNAQRQVLIIHFSRQRAL